MKLYDKYENLHDQFQILAFHDDTAKTLEELDEKLQPIIEEQWGGRELPFPILMDATGKTIRQYGITSYPTVILIDPEGKLVREGGQRAEPKLEEILAEMAGQ